jgi:uncharacterized protein YgiM (DUF1202 family)
VEAATLWRHSWSFAADVPTCARFFGSTASSHQVSSRHDYGCAELFTGSRGREPVHIAKKLSSLAFLVALTPGGVRAEPMYVIEQLVVAVNSAPAGAGDRVGTIKSGERVELLNRQGDEAQIQLPTGASGWVKAAYLSTQEPLQKRLQDRTSELEKLRQDVSRLESQLAARPAAAAVTSNAPGSGSTAASPAPSGTPASSESGPVRDASPLMSPAEQSSEAPWLWVLASSAGALIVGFIAGWRMLDRRIRRKYGGLRIY